MRGKSWLVIRDSNVAVKTLLLPCLILILYQRYKSSQVAMSRMGECDARMFRNVFQVLIPEATSGNGSAPRAKQRGKTESGSFTNWACIVWCIICIVDWDLAYQVPPLFFHTCKRE